MNILGAIFIFTVSYRVCAGLFLQTAEVQVFVGGSVVLPCNGSGFSVDELQIHWEAMGKDVISLSGEDLAVGRGFEDRVNFISDPAHTQDFSLILSDVILNDGEIYECLWEGTKPICSVLLRVLTPEFSSSQVESFEGDDVTLDCFGNIPKNKPWEDTFIQWIKDDREILRLSSGETDVMIDYITLPSEHDISRGIFSLTIKSVSMFDQGVYQCRYKSTDYEAPRSGFPESHTLTVWAVLSGMTDVTESLSSASESSHPHTSSSVPAWTAVVSVQTEAGSTAPAYAYATSAQTESNNTLPTYTYAASTQTQTTSSTEPTYTHTEGSEEPETSTTHTLRSEEPETSTTHTLRSEEPETSTTHTLRGGDTEAETSTSTADADRHTSSLHSEVTDMLLPEAGTVPGHRDPLEFVSDEQIPWIRIGLISGVLLLTALVLGLLLAFGRI